MKKINYLYALLSAVLLFGFSGCKKEQTELNIDDSQYHAIIQGTLVYPAGHSSTTDLGGTPASNQKVYVDVPASYYASAPHEAKKRFYADAPTGSDGKFTIKIPVKMAATTAIIGVESFQGKHFIFDYVETQGTFTPKFEQKDVIYSYGGAPINISASNQLINKNITLAYNPIDAVPEFKYVAKYSFNVEVMSKRLLDNVPVTEWIPKRDKQVVVKITRGYNNYFYLGTSNVNGVVIVDIPIKALNEEVLIEVTSAPYRDILIDYVYNGTEYEEVRTHGVFFTYGFYEYYMSLDALKLVNHAGHPVRFDFRAD
jgi:hypothetical protein